MTEFKMNKNASGYSEQVAYDAIMGMAKRGEIWQYTDNNGKKKNFLILGNHGKHCSALAVYDDDDGTCIEIEYNDKLVYTNPTMVQYIYNSNLGNCLGKLPEYCFVNVLEEIGKGLSIPTTNAVTEQKKNNVDHPSHYQGKYECIIEMVALFGVEAVKAFCMCNVYKYRYRASRKNGEEDIEKAEWYMTKLMELGGE